MTNNIDSKDQWFSERWSMFTASENYKLLVAGTKGEMFGVGAWTYIRKKAVEAMTFFYERPDLEEVKSLLHGKAFELPAFERYVQVTRNHSMRYFGTENPLYLAYNDYSGGSPDGLLGEGTTIHLGLELKNPKDPAVHYLHLQLKDQFALKDQFIDKYTQCQMLLLCSGAPEWHFVSHDDRYKDKAKKLKILEIKPDEKFQDSLKVRLMQANKEKLKLIEHLNN